MGKQLIIVLSVMSLFLIPINATAAPLWPLHVGDVRVYQEWDTHGGGYHNETDQIFREVVIDSQVFYGFQPEGTPFNESNFVRSTENAIYSWNDGIYSEFIIDSSTPTATITVPYGGPYTAYVETEIEDDYIGGPTTIYNYYVPGIGYIGLMEYTNTGEFLYSEELVSWQTSAVPIPGAVWLLGSGLFGLIGLRKRIYN